MCADHTEQTVNEAVRRKAKTSRDASKPLSLEYMADRLDVDDPIFGYLAVTKDKGWMQGFVLCTTFTTWHRSFRWDSTNPVIDLLASPHDDDDDEGEPSGRHGSPGSSGSTAGASSADAPRRAVDADGTLAVELMRELYAGDPDGEGVVWPRVAELSLLCLLYTSPSPRDS